MVEHIRVAFSSSCPKSLYSRFLFSGGAVESAPLVAGSCAGPASFSATGSDICFGGWQHQTGGDKRGKSGWERRGV